VQRAAAAGAAYQARKRAALGLPPDWRVRVARMTAAQWLKRQAEGKPPSPQSIGAAKRWERWRAERGLPADWRYGPVGVPAAAWLAEQTAKQQAEEEPS
jgi:hypothetical protein